MIIAPKSQGMRPAALSLIVFVNGPYALDAFRAKKNLKVIENIRKPKK